MTTVRDVLCALAQIAPPALAEDWDSNIGLLIGDEDAPVDKIGVCLDITAERVQAAAALGLTCLVSHHPVTFHLEPRHFLAPNPAYACARAGMAALAAHTNLDAVRGGVNDALCAALGLSGEIPGDADAPGALLRVATLPEACTPQAFAAHIAEKLHASVRYVDGGQTIHTVALCSGGAGEYWARAVELGCDAFVTGEARHHEFLAAKAAGISLFAAGHYETEIVVVEPLATRLRSLLPGVEVLVLPEENPVTTAP
ncbi:MAG: Nif3-like dinuclear metal center hexameric protein [Oscillospiraceae bacterium]|jgi:dinuclear metal center YbgI/SA1388 family protein|nr:Nif3-like dinuclear metal center hexameric protein [Oscillospiraceae bacterium]